MRAAAGDRMVVAATHVDGPLRDGEIVRTGSDGGAPYVVRWEDTGRETVFYPGPDAHVEHLAAEPAPVAEPGETVSHTKHWQVDVYLYERGDSTTAQAVLHADAPDPLTTQGEAGRRPGDPAVPEVGDELAVGRALRRLGDRLLGQAADDLAGPTGR
jgi:hypothetical protein